MRGAVWLGQVSVAALAAFVVVASCGGSHVAPEPGSGRQYRVLFIGNSLTYFNDLPGTTAQLAGSGDDTIQVRSVARPNFALIDHANGLSEALDLIRGGGWDHVVLQQGPSALPESRDTLIIATRILDSAIRAAGGRTALLMVWPESSRFTVFDDVRDSYLAAAQDVGGLFLPAGEAWRTAWSEDPSLMFYGPDGYHPAPVGTFLAALVVYEGITSHDTRALPGDAVSNGQPLRLPESKVRLLQRAAHETVARFKSSVVVTPPEPE
jgi:hypothetical protein